VDARAPTYVRKLGRKRYWEDNIKTELRVVGRGVMDSFRLAHQYGNELSGLIKCGQFLFQLSNC
jgi:hypothetical protein